MDILVQWVTQIIIFILIATIVDMLIPANSMKKYIHFVIGLILILIFLQPFFYLFNINIEEALTTSVVEVMENGDVENIENLIDLQKSEIESTQNAYILEQMAVQLKELANPALIEAHQVEIIAMDFSFKESQPYDFENLEKVIVLVTENEEGEGTIQTVEDIVINTEEPIQRKNNKNTEEIERFLEEIWELYDKQLSVIWEGGAS